MITRVFLLLFISLAPLFAAPLPSITDVSVRESGVTLKLSKPLLSTPKKYSMPHQDKSKQRFYADFGAKLAVPFVNSKNSSFPEIKVAQFDKDTVRVVIIADKKANFSIVEGNGFTGVKLIGESTKESPGEKIIKKTESEKNSPKDDALKKEEDKTVIVHSKKKRVVIDPGHGGKDSGAIGDGDVMEKSIVLKVSQILFEMLEKKGYTVYLTRENDTFIELRDRTDFANKKNADLFISIHANAIDTKRSIQGIETYFLSPARSERAKKAAEKENGVAMMDAFSKQTFLNFLNHEKIIASNKLAIDIQRGLLSYTRSKYKDTVDGGVKEAPFWVLVGAQMPAVLVELGYLTNELELERLQEEYYKALLAKGIMEGIEIYFQNN
ncbi:MAG TPA: N-acetylmuramoyl-L-alanine amidase [Campylobacterales bacterium]|nr:N-acetylmuramoyl-L-alanine amidase [Campylobacterales bacterium]